MRQHRMLDVVAAHALTGAEALDLSESAVM
jgi:hypothetical protein